MDQAMSILRGMKGHTVAPRSIADIAGRMGVRIDPAIWEQAMIELCKTQEAINIDGDLYMIRNA